MSSPHQLSTCTSQHAVVALWSLAQMSHRPPDLAYQRLLDHVLQAIRAGVCKPQVGVVGGWVGGGLCAQA